MKDVLKRGTKTQKRWKGQEGCRLDGGEQLAESSTL